MTSLYFLTSRDYDGFEPPLAYDVVRRAQVPQGKDAVLIKLRGAFDLADYGLSEQERYLIIATRHKGTRIRDAEDGETVFVNIFRTRKSLFGGRRGQAGQKDLIAWGEVYCEETD
ncbi:hypothetical protein [Maricaulis sp.]|uniref:hypothetical protein n=1 Tax=Maricaulis sp. TaxID=1486257 RepID=UPI003A9026CC